MTSLHLKRRSNRRASTLGLVLSLALIVSASGIIGVNAVAPESQCPHAEEAAEYEANEKGAGSYSVSPTVRTEGHREDHRTL